MKASFRFCFQRPCWLESSRPHCLLIVLVHLNGLVGVNFILNLQGTYAMDYVTSEWHFKYLVLKMEIWVWQIFRDPDLSLTRRGQIFEAKYLNIWHWLPDGMIDLTKKHFSFSIDNSASIHEARQNLRNTGVMSNKNWLPRLGHRRSYMWNCRYCGRLHRIVLNMQS